MRTALLFSFATLLVPSYLSAEEKIATPLPTKSVTYKVPEQDADDAARRCAFLGRQGSFHLIGAQGTAAYRLGNGQYIADLAAAGEDANYWYYRPQQNGDQFTSLWAFARRPNCGRYWVWRQDRGGWHRYEATNAWGIGLGGVAAKSGSSDAIVDLQIDVRDLKERVLKLEKGPGK
jgi:hypothetical protein